MLECLQRFCVQQRKSKVTFDDIAGLDEEKEELIEIVDFLKTPENPLKIGRGFSNIRHPLRQNAGF